MTPPTCWSGGAGNDRIVPDDNPAGTRDVARGDAGDDAIVWNPGDDDDLNDGGDGNDTSEVNGGSGGEQFTVRPSMTSLGGCSSIAPARPRPARSTSTSARRSCCA